MMRKPAVLGWVLMPFFLLTPAARADVVVLEPVRDTTLCEDPDGLLGNGAAEAMFAGQLNSGQTRRALIAFGVADLIPSGSTINSVALTLHMSRTQAGPTAVSLHRVLADWGEGDSGAGGQGGGCAPSSPGDATWIHTFYDTGVWTTPGGDFAPASSAMQTVDAVGDYVWDGTAEMVADVQAWLDEPGADFGWIVLGDETSLQTAKRFDTREHPDPTVRPALTVDFTPPASSEPVAYESPDPRAIIATTNEVGRGPSPIHVSFPSPRGDALYYKVDDGFGHPQVITLIRSGRDLLIVY